MAFKKNNPGCNCCEPMPVSCGDCDLSAADEFEITLPALGTFLLTNAGFTLGTCVWEYNNGGGPPCGKLGLIRLATGASLSGHWSLEIYRHTIATFYVGPLQWLAPLFDIFDCDFNFTKTSIFTVSSAFDNRPCTGWTDSQSLTWSLARL